MRSRQIGWVKIFPKKVRGENSKNLCWNHHPDIQTTSNSHIGNLTTPFFPQKILKNPHQVIQSDLFGMVKTWPFGKVVGDLQRSGVKRSRLESPGTSFFLLLGHVGPNIMSTPVKIITRPSLEVMSSTRPDRAQGGHPEKANFSRGMSCYVVVKSLPPLSGNWSTSYSRGFISPCMPGDSKWPFYPLVGGHLTFLKGHLTIPKRSQRTATWCFFLGGGGWKVKNTQHFRIK